MSLFSVQQLAAASGRANRTIRHHVASGWLKAEPKAAGVRGLRFSKRSAQTWLNRHFPGKQI